MILQPIDFTFPGQEEEEKVYLKVRKHIFILIKNNIIFLFFLLFPIIIWIALIIFEIELSKYPFFPIIILFASLYYLFVFLFILINWIEYYYDIWIITDRRLIDIEQKSLFNHVTSELRLNKIQDVTFEMKGFLPSMFHFGNIYVQTAGSVQRFSFEQIPQSQIVKRLIIDLQGQLERNKESL